MCHVEQRLFSAEWLSRFIIVIKSTMHLFTGKTCQAILSSKSTALWCSAICAKDLASTIRTFRWGRAQTHELGYTHTHTCKDCPCASCFGPLLLVLGKSLSSCSTVCLSVSVCLSLCLSVSLSLCALLYLFFLHPPFCSGRFLPRFLDTPSQALFLGKSLFPGQAVSWQPTEVSVSQFSAAVPLPCLHWASAGCGRLGVGEFATKSLGLTLRMSRWKPQFVGFWSGQMWRSEGRSPSLWVGSSRPCITMISWGGPPPPLLLSPLPSPYPK